MMRIRLGLVKNNILLDNLSLKSLMFKVGFPQEKDAVHMRDGEENVATIAAINEYGQANDFPFDIPARPFLEPAFRRRKRFIKNAMGRALQKALKPENVTLSDNKMQSVIEKEFAQIAENMVGAVKAGVVNMKEPPNAPYTVKKKGFDDPLIETGQMADSVQYVMKKGTL